MGPTSSTNERPRVVSSTRVSHPSQLRLGLLVGILLTSAPLLSASVAGAQGRRGTVERLAGDLLKVAAPTLDRYGDTDRYGLAWAMRYKSPPRAGKKDRLEGVLRSLLEARLADRSGFRPLVALTASPGLSRAQLRESARKAGTDLLLIIDVFISRNHLHIVGELHEVRATFWARIRRPVAGMRSHFYSSERIDAEIRALMNDDTSRTRRRFQLRPAPPKIAAGIGPLLAAGIGDVDGDGFAELAVLGSTSLRIVRLGGTDRLKTIIEYPLSDLARAAQKPRDPIGSLHLADLNGDGHAEIAFWMSALRDGHLMTMRQGALIPIRWPAAIKGSTCGHAVPRTSAISLCGASVGSIAPMDQRRAARARLLLARTVPGRNHFDGRLATWSIRGEEPFHPHPGLYWNLAAHSLKRKEAGIYTDLIATVDRGGLLQVRGGKQTWKAKGVGSAMTLSDLNDDGEAELVRAADSMPNASDELVIQRLSPNKRMPTIFRQRSAPIRAITAGDVDNDGHIEVVVLTNRGISILEERWKRHRHR